MPGPTPDPNALRRDRKDDKASWVILPAAGRPGDAPAWPISRASTRERKQWDREWARPQAIEWERNGQTEEVALYVRTLIRCEDPDVGPTLLAQMRAMQEALGLSQPGLARRRWKIEDVTVDARSTRPQSADATRARLRAIEGGAA